MDKWLIHHMADEMDGINGDEMEVVGVDLLEKFIMACQQEVDLDE